MGKMSTQDSAKFLQVSIPTDYENVITSPRSDSLSSKMKKILSSPKVNRGKPVISLNKTFGVPLEFLFDRDKTEVPLIVSRICEHLKAHGLRQEGLFRVNGNMKLVDRLKTSFDKCGDADIEEMGDVPACASLLKMFLRELSDPVIPDDLQPLFVRVQDQYSNEKTKAVPLVKELIKRMPELNSSLLKYLCEFMLAIAQESNVNKMTLLALAIVFGPNIFRCGEGLAGLRDQAYVNAVLLLMLQEYEELFLIDNDQFADSVSRTVPGKPMPYIEHMKTKKEKEEAKEKPERPPPPRISLDQDLNGDFVSSDSSPRRSPSKKRITKRKSPRGSPKQETNENKMKSSAKKKSPTKKEPMRSGSPTNYSSPLSRHFVDTTINYTVKEHLFGPGLVTSSVESDSIEDVVPLHTSEVAHMYPSVKDQIKKFSAKPSANPNECPKKRLSISEENVRNEKRTSNSRNKSSSSYLSVPEIRTELTDDDLDYIGESSGETLYTLTSSRAQPPTNRRKPSFVSKGIRSASYNEARTNSIYNSAEYFQLESSKETINEISPRNQRSSHKDRLETKRLENLMNRRNSLGSIGKSHSVAADEITTVTLAKKSSSADALASIPVLDFDRINEDGEEAQRSSRERYHMRNNEDPLRSPQSSAPSSPRLKERRHEFWNEKRQDTVPMVDLSPQDLRRRITALKKIVSNFELNFEETNGRKPKPSEKSNIQKYIAELGRAKKQLKELMSDYKENPELLAETPVIGPDYGTAPNLREPFIEPDEPTKEMTLKNLLKKLEDKRLSAGRPHEMQAMTPDQLKDEKLAIQKVLLQYENLHGRPTTKDDKTLMRPLYDRYRKIKRRITTGKTTSSPSNESIVSSVKPDTASSPRRNPDPPKKTQDQQRQSEKNNRVPLISMPTDNTNNDDTRLNQVDDDLRYSKKDDEYANDTLGDTFSVTRRFTNDTPEPLSPHEESLRSIDEAVLHDATIGELLDQQRATKRVKKRLGKILKDYEDEYFNTWNRRMQKEDRLPREAEYREYKLVKAKLRLVDALIAKKSANNTV